MEFAELNAFARTPNPPLPDPGEGGPVMPGGDQPGSLLPNPGEGGPVMPGGGQPGSLLPDPGEGGPVMPSGDQPGSLLPNPGEGGPVMPGGGQPGSLLPDPGEGGPVMPGGGQPGSLLPNPGEGGPVAPGPGTPVFPDSTPIYPNRPGQTIPIVPLPAPPCFFCNTASTCQVRFLNAAGGYRPFRVAINGRSLFTRLGYASITGYGRVSDGFHTVTVTGANGYIYLQKTVPFRAGDSVTLAIITTAGGIDLLPISDMPCSKPYNMSCFRVCNLAYGSNPLDVILYDGRVVYTDVRYKEVTTFKRIRPGAYQFYVAETSLSPMPYSMDIETLDSAFNTAAFPEAIVSFGVDVSPNAMYTVYLLNGSSTTLQTLTVEDQL